MDTINEHSNEKRKKENHMNNDNKTSNYFHKKKKKKTSNYTHESMLQTEDIKNTNLWVQMYIFL